MNEKTIKETLLKGERVTLECKKAKAEVPKSIWQTYSAFANTIGGMILLGVNEDLQEKHDDRLCFRNPGLLKLPVETIYRGGNSKARNPKIQNMLRMIGFGENVGSGFPKIIAAWKEAGWGEPQLLNKLDVDEVELILPVPSPKSSNAGLSNEFSIELPEGLSIRLSKELSKGLSETAATMFKMIYADNYITRGDMAGKIGISVTAVQKHINKLKSLKFIERDGSTGHGNWKIVE
ncbi:MAG: putative DNA binding domain-containing protein [Prevotella sp.]|nr:putative DNA binding domain-containing protein [Prevotella sp.]